MKPRLSKKQQWFKQIHLTQDDQLYVGIDVHKDSYHLAFWLNDRLAIDFVMPANNQQVLATLQKLRIAVKTIVYEAGPTGYSLARLLQKHHLPIEVIAPTATPRSAASQAKTDRLDCRKLAQFAAKGLLRKIAIPTPQQEADRQLTRLRQQIVPKFRRIKIQIKSFLLQHGIPEPQGLTSWSNAAIAQLHTLLLTANLRYCLDTFLTELLFLKEQLKNVDAKIKQLSQQKNYQSKINTLKTHPGIGPTIAAQYATEIFNPKRFHDKTQIAKYVGRSPQITQSGKTLRDGPIVKTGRPELRCNLIEAAWIWIRKDPHAYQTYCRIRTNTGHQNKAITAMARKLAVNLWKMLCDEKPYQPQTTLNTTRSA